LPLRNTLYFGDNLIFLLDGSTHMPLSTEHDSGTDEHGNLIETVVATMTPEQLLQIAEAKENEYQICSKVNSPTQPMIEGLRDLASRMQE
jgi:hypothetical protein